MPNKRHKEKPTSIALVVNQNEIFYRLRMPWIRLLRGHGYEVYAVVASGDWNDRIEAGGAKFVEWKLSRSGRNPLAEVGSILGLSRILRRIKPDIVQNFHSKPNIYAPIAAKLAGVPVTVSTVTGLGYTFVDRSGFGSSIGRRMNLGMYKFANRLADEVAFQNPDDMDLLKTRGGIAHSKGRFITGGSGVDVSEYHPGTRNTAESIELRKSLGIAEDVFVTMFVGRLQLDKGLVEFVEAARMVKQKRQDVVFVCNPTSLHVDTIVQALDAGSHVFTEKPVATTLEECEAIQVAITRSGKSVMVGYNMRFHPALMKVKSWIDSGRIGNVIYARTQRSEYLPGWHPWEDYREAMPRDPISYSGSSASTPT